MGTPVIVDAVRTPQGKKNGVLAGLHPAVLLGMTQAEVISRAGMPNATASTEIDAQCSSAQQATHLIHAMIGTGLIKAGIACGVESMSRVPLGANVPPGTGSPRPDG